jgi:glutamyl-tRNA synthetase
VALRRRGIQPDAIRKFVLGFGMSKTDGSVGIEPLFVENKKIIDKTSRRLYYVPAPVDLSIKNFDKMNLELPLHPSENMGSRKCEITERVYIPGEDASQLKDGETIKLKGAFCVAIKREDDSWTGEIVEKKEESAMKSVQWVSEGSYLKCSILVPGAPLDDEGNFIRDSLQKNNGYIENYALSLNKGDIVQLERFGFCILDDKQSMQFIFISK